MPFPQSARGLAISSPSNFGLPASVWPATLALLIACVGGYLFATLHIPLAYMLGAIVCTMVAAMAGLPIKRPSMYLVTPMRASLGVLMGSAITPDMMNHAAALGAAAAIVPVFVVISGAIGTFYYHRVAGFTRDEAFFSALPGGLHAMTLYAEESGVDIRRVALAHALRITFVVLLAPAAVSFLMHVPSVSVAKSTMSILAIDRMDLLLLTIAGAVGWFIGWKSKMPGGQMVGPLVASALLHIFGVTTAKPPVELIVASQIVIGASIGARYVGEKFAIVWQAVIYGFGYVAITLSIAVLFAWILHELFALPIVTGILCFAPGGMSELGLIAIGLGLDVGFVATIQVSRLLTIAIVAPIAYQRIRHLLGS